MSAGLEAVGDVATGAAFAHAVEPRGGTHDAVVDRAIADSAGVHGLCLNCGTALIDLHCHRCGQAGHVHRTAGAFFHDVLHGVFHFEGKAWRTLPMLVFHPGALTRRYAAGERVRFVSPIALFLFSVFLLFAILAQLPMFHFTDKALFAPGAGLSEVQAKVAAEQQDTNRTLAVLRRTVAEQRRAATPDPAAIAHAQRRIAEAEDKLDDLRSAQRVLPSASATTHDRADWLGAMVDHAKENPRLVLYKLKSSGYKYSWALIPLSLPFLWVLFPFSRRFGFYDHSVFATYSLTFMSLLTIVAALLMTVGVSTGLVLPAALIAATVHIYKQLKGGYSLSRGGALIRTLVLCTFICWAIVPLFLTALLYLGLAD